MSSPIYLDYAATTPVDDRVMDAMRPYFSLNFGNPSSVHQRGQQAEKAVEDARETVARVLKCSPAEIVFTSCGTESDNLALRGAAQAARADAGGNRILTMRTEHPAVGKTAQSLASDDAFAIAWLTPNEQGAATREAVRAALDDKSALVSIMYANNEIGTINPIRDISAECRKRGVTLHTDAVQAGAYLDLDVDLLGVDLMSLGGHKFYGPKGVGVLYVRSGTRLRPTQTGGSQEFGLRAGTQNVPLVVGFARALQLAQEERAERVSHVMTLRDHIIGEVLERVPDSQLTGSPTSRLPNHASFVFRAVDGNLLLMLLDSAGFACSSGSACKTGNPEPSDVLTAMGVPPDWGLGSLRVTVGRETTANDVDAFLDALPPLVEKARALKRI